MERIIIVTPPTPETPSYCNASAALSSGKRGEAHKKAPRPVGTRRLL